MRSGAFHCCATDCVHQPDIQLLRLFSALFLLLKFWRFWSATVLSQRRASVAMVLCSATPLNAFSEAASRLSVLRIEEECLEDLLSLWLLRHFVRFWRRSRSSARRQKRKRGALQIRCRLGRPPARKDGEASAVVFFTIGESENLKMDIFVLARFSLLFRRIEPLSLHRASVQTALRQPRY